MSDDFLNVVAMAFIGLILLASGFFIGVGMGAGVKEKEAVERGFAHYVADQKTGRVTFEWKENE